MLEKEWILDDLRSWKWCGLLKGGFYWWVDVFAHAHSLLSLWASVSFQRFLLLLVFCRMYLLKWCPLMNLNALKFTRNKVSLLYSKIICVCVRSVVIFKEYFYACFYHNIPLLSFCHTYICYCNIEKHAITSPHDYPKMSVSNKMSPRAALNLWSTVTAVKLKLGCFGFRIVFNVMSGFLIFFLHLRFLSGNSPES